MNTSAKLIFLCGKMAAGKSTLARDLAKRENAILLAVIRKNGCLSLVLPDTFHQIEVGESSPVFVHVGLPVGSDQDRTQVGNTGCVGRHQ